MIKKQSGSVQDATFSIIIPHKPEEEVSRIIPCLKRLDYRAENIEVILVEGRHPSFQRNSGAKLANGDILCFLDHDCIPFPRLLKEIMRGFADRKDGIAAVGGPCILHPKDWLNALFSHTLVSFFSHYKMRARYMRLGEMRSSDEKELIGSNLCIRKDVFSDSGGFKEVLYPNEENELLNRLKSHDAKVIYNPDAAVGKEIKWSVREYARKFFKYGNGRGRELFEESIKLNLIYFVPVFFCFYLAGLAFVHDAGYAVFLAAYLLASLFSGLTYMRKNKRIVLAAMTPVIFILMHASYASGMLWAVFRKLTGLESGRKENVIKVRRIKELGAGDYVSEIKAGDVTR